MPFIRGAPCLVVADVFGEVCPDFFVNDFYALVIGIAGPVVELAPVPVLANVVHVRVAFALFCLPVGSAFRLRHFDVVLVCVIPALVHAGGIRIVEVVMPAEMFLTTHIGFGRVIWAHVQFTVLIAGHVEGFRIDSFCFVPARVKTAYKRFADGLAPI